MKRDDLTGDLFSGAAPLHHVVERPKSIRRTRASMASVESNAGTEWREQALGYVKRFAAITPEFLAEDCRHWAEGLGLEKPHHERAWGPLMLHAEKIKIVRRVGHGRAADSNQAWVLKWARA